MRDGLNRRWRIIPEGTTEFYAFMGSSNPTTQQLSSAGVFDSSGALVRTLWSTVSTPINTVPAVNWDGTLDDGSVAPTGTYTIKILTNQVNYTWEGVIGNTSTEHGTMTYHNEACVIRDMAITPSGEIYYISSYSERWPTVLYTTPTTLQVANYALFLTFRTGYSSQLHCCTDGTTAFFAVKPVDGINRTSFAYGISTSTKALVVYPSGTLINNFFITNDNYGIAYDVAGVAFENVITGMAVQQSGNFLFLSRSTQNKVLTIDKTTGATLQTNLTFTSPSVMATNPVTGELWLVNNSTTISKLTADGGGNLTATGVSIAGLQNALAVAVSPDGTTLLVADGGNSQQVKAFNTSDGSAKVAWGSAGTLGTSGGYAASPAVTNTKFMFQANAGFTGDLQSYIAYAPDGSFWLGDSGNCRNLHFSSGNSPAYIEQISYIPAFYSCRLFNNDDTRVLGAWLEWKIDYSKSFDSCATLANNWAYGISPSDIAINQFRALTFAGTYSGHSYASVKIGGANKIYEMTSSGLRDTGQTIGDPIYIDKNFDQYFIETKVPGQVCHISKNTFTGLDGSNNPTWAHSMVDFQTLYTANDPSVVVVTSQILPALFPVTSANDSNIPTPIDPLSNGVIPIYDVHATIAPSDTNNHFGGIDSATGNVKFNTHPVNPTNHGGTNVRYLLYPETPYYPVGDGMTDNGGAIMQYRSGETDIFTGYIGESWGNNQTNVWSHWHQSGLMIGQFGVAAPYFAAVSLEYPNIGGNVVDNPQSFYSFKGMLGMAGNARWGGLAKQSGNYYLYHNDEWYHSGIHRWKISNLDSVSISTLAPISWNSTNYVAPTANPNDMLAGLPYNQSSLANNTANWQRLPANDTTTSFISPGPWFKVYTNAVTCDPCKPRDLVVEAVFANQTCTVSRPLTRTGSGDWIIDITMLVSNLGGLFSVSDPNKDNLLFLDILDGSNKKILRMHSSRDFDASTGSFYVNDTAIVGSFDINTWGSYAGRNRRLLIQATVGTGLMKVTYADYSITKGVYDVGADMTSPATFRFTYVGSVGPFGDLVGYSISQFTFQ